MTGTAPGRVPLLVPLSALAASLAGAVALAGLAPDIVPPRLLGGAVLLALALLAVRLSWARRPEHSRRWFWANTALLVPAVFVSPSFGLSGFLGFPESESLPTRREAWAGLAATAAVVAVAQTGGPRSAIFQPWVWAVFFAITFGIAALMSALDRRRSALMRELAEANARLNAEQDRAAALSAQLVARAREAGVEQERHRLSREIHDTVAQDLVAIIAQVQAARDAPDRAELDRRLRVADSAARDALAEARRAVHALASPRLDEADLPLALDDVLGHWRETSGLAGEFSVTGPPRPTPHDDALVKIVQEALANVARHAAAARADVALTYTDEAVAVRVTDDGRGFDPRVAPRGHGLPNMQERAAAAGGTLEVAARPGGGSVVTARLPRNPREDP